MNKYIFTKEISLTTEVLHLEMQAVHHNKVDINLMGTQRLWSIERLTGTMS